MKNFISILFLLILFSCTRTTPDLIYDINVSIHYVDSTKNELFNNSSNGYIIDNVRLYYMDNNNKILIFTPTTVAYIPDYPFGYEIDSSIGQKKFTIFSNNNVVNDTAITYIKLKSNVEDTLKCSFIHPNSNPKSIQWDKVWYNGKVQSRSFEVIKNK